MLILLGEDQFRTGQVQGGMKESANAFIPDRSGPADSGWGGNPGGAIRRVIAKPLLVAVKHGL